MEFPEAPELQIQPEQKKRLASHASREPVPRALAICPCG
jgi:hypothetical protein